MNREKFGRRNVRNHRDIKDGENFITLDISLKHFSLDKIKITISEPEDYLGRSGKGFITYMGTKTIVRLKKKKRAKYAINNVSLKKFPKLLINLRSCIMRVMCGRGPNIYILTVTVI